MRYCFNLASSIISNIPEAVVDITANEDFIRRRFGVSSSGTAVEYNILGEPVDLNADIYNDLAFEGNIKKIELVDDCDSVVGGRPSSEKERLEVYFDPSLDIKMGDTVQRVLTGDWFVIKRIVTTRGGTFTYFIGFSEVRSTK